jgi:hypothetical protein
MNLISHSKTSIIDDLANDSTKEDENITLKFYLDYKNARLNLYKLNDAEIKLIERENSNY